jgi:cytohesin
MAGPRSSRRITAAAVVAALLLPAVSVTGGCAGRTSRAAQGASDDVTYAEGRDADLLRAAAAGNVFKVRDLLDAGASINARTPNGSTPLMGAIYYGYPQTAEMLISRGADVTIPNDQGATPLHQAAWNGEAHIARLLVIYGADVDARTRDGITPLMWAAVQGQDEASQVLIQAGAEVDARSPNGQTAADFAAQSGHAAMAAFLASVAKGGG